MDCLANAGIRNNPVTERARARERAFNEEVVIETLASSVMVTISGALAWGGVVRLREVDAFTTVLGSSGGWVLSVVLRLASYVVGGGQVLLGGAILAGVPGAATTCAVFLVCLSVACLLAERRNLDGSCGCPAPAGLPRGRRATYIRSLVLLTGATVLILSPSPQVSVVSLSAGMVLLTTLLLADVFLRAQQGWEQMYARHEEPLRSHTARP